jgi:hypothetical protein
MSVTNLIATGRAGSVVLLGISLALVFVVAAAGGAGATDQD